MLMVSEFTDFSYFLWLFPRNTIQCNRLKYDGKGESQMKKIAFFDIDGTLTSEIDGSIPQSAITASKLFFMFLEN